MNDLIIKEAKRQFGLFAKKRREDLGLSYYKLAQLSGVAIPAIRSIETGESAYTVDKMMALMHGLDLYMFFAEREGRHLDGQHMNEASGKPIGPELPPDIPNN